MEIVALVAAITTLIAAFIGLRASIIQSHNNQKRL